jgi:hypothetical protein
MEKIRHAVHEDKTTFLPSGREGQGLRNQSNIEALFEWVPWDTTEALSKRLGIAMLTTR